MEHSGIFVGFNSSDIHYCQMMLARERNQHGDFSFANCQHSQEISTDGEAYFSIELSFPAVDEQAVIAVFLDEAERGNQLVA